MAGKISRRDLLKGQFVKKRSLKHLNPKWPTEQVAKSIKQKLSDTPPITKLTEYSDSPSELNIISSNKRLRAVDWNEETAAHLLRRTLFAPTFTEIQSAANSTLEETIDQLLSDQTLPGPPEDWVNEAAPDWDNLSEQDINNLVDLYFSRIDVTREWWMNLMSAPVLSIRETMTLFWHDHFATGSSKVFFPQAVYGQNNILRENCLGNFKTMVRKTTFDPAMMIWLDIIDSTKDAPNENFAREVLELFTLGVDNYTQNDIVEGARAFTGYLTDGVETNYDYNLGAGNSNFWNYYNDNHDFTEKTFLGQTGNWNGDDIINIIFEQSATAKFICTKLYQWFLYENVDDSFVDGMADVLRNSNYNIKTVMEYLLTSEHFYDPVLRGAIIKNPLNIVQGGIRQFGLHDKVFPDDFLIDWQWFMGMMPLDPPDVSGWPGYRSWLNSITFPIRKIALINLLDGDGWEDLGFMTDVKKIAQSTTAPNDAEILVKDLALLMFGTPLTETLKSNLLTALLDGMSISEWNINAVGAEDRLRNLFRYMARLPEYQLI
ncbi:MAG: DUF1800 family protein [Planctomycetia bacterium]|nr:DUF1800 family protein [Planctomycetia bacterium]